MNQAIIDKLLSEQIIISLRKIIRAVDLQSKKMMKEVGLTTPQYIILKLITDNPGSSVSEVAKSSSLSQATATPIIEKLVKAGYVIRNKSEIDKRRHQLTPTEQGQEILRSAPAPLQETFLRQLSKVADWEKSLLLASLQKVAHMMNAEDIAADPVLTNGELKIE